METKLNLKSNLELNEKLPDNVWVHEFGMKQFEPMLNKLDGLWTEVILPKTEEDEYVPWCMAYTKYTIDNTDKYLIWFFDNNEIDHHVTNHDMVYREIIQFLEENNESIS